MEKELKNFQNDTDKDLNEVSGGIREEITRLKEEKEKKLTSREGSWRKWDNLFKNNG